MNFKLVSKKSEAFKISLQSDSGEEIGRASIYLINNDLHDKAYALLEDVFVNEEHRGKGLGKQLVEKAVKEAKNQGCYKIIGTSRNTRLEVHTFYKQLGFEQYGFEFRMNLEQ